MASILESDLSRGIGQLLHEKRIRVPFYQRSYAWKKNQVNELYDDLRRAIDEGREYYFLGSIVGCQKNLKTDEVQIVDGQQRLATTTILLAAIRDKLLMMKESDLATKFEETFLFTTSGLKNPITRANMVLNETDNDFFQKRIISQPNSADRKIEVRWVSHRLIVEAAKIAANFVESITGNRQPTDQKGELDKWVDFIRDKARVIFITVEDEAEAFIVFETLNDRGLDLTIADLTKNYLFMMAGKDNIETAKANWSRMTGALITTSDSEVAKVYIHHLWSSFHGVSRDKEVFGDLRKKYDNSVKAMEFTRLLADKAEIYAALRNSDSEFWNPHGMHAKRHLKILNTSLRVTQIRMLMLAVVDCFKVTDVAKILTCSVWWSVRFLVAGGSPGTWESHYAKRARLIRDNEIKNADELIASMERDVPGDDQFKAAFATEATSAKPIARYFLQCLSKCLEGAELPHLGEDDEKIADLEHIMPQSLNANAWVISEADHERLYNRLGNLTLLTPDENKRRGNGPFVDALPIYASCGFKITQKIDVYPKWDEAAIDNRQATMADLAVKIWPIKPLAKPLKKKK